MARLDKIDGEWVNLEKPGGQVIFVGGGTVAYKGRGASDGGADSGRDPKYPMATIQGALNKCVTNRGDTIVLLPGNVTITAALAMNKADVTLTGVDPNGVINPSAITVNAAIDGIAVTAANVIIEDLHFKASTLTGVTSRIDAGAAGLTVRGCTFECGQYDLETITVPAAGLHTTVEGNRFYVTANGPDAAVEIEAAAAHFVRIVGNEFNGQNDTNGWDIGAVNSGVANLSCTITDNINNFGPAIILSAAATGVIARNMVGEGTLGSMIDPGSCMCFNNYEADAIDESGRLFPTTVAL